MASRRLRERAWVVLLATEGKTNEQIAAELGMSCQKAGRWRSRFVEKGRIGIEGDKLGRGRKMISVEVRERLVEKTTQSTPSEATQWSLVSMGKAMALSPSTM